MAPSPKASVPVSALREHRSSQSALPLWTSIEGVVYDVTAFASRHPGGRALIELVCGKDGTRAFAAVHPRDLAARLLADSVVGPLDPAGLMDEDVAVYPPPKSAGGRAGPAPPPLEQMLNAFDFEAVARAVLASEAWGYYSSGADDEISLRENHAAFHRIWLRPRVLVNVRSVDTSRSLFPGSPPSRLPVYVSATAMGRLAHPEGEAAIVRASHTSGVTYMLPTLSSCSLDEMLVARAPGQELWSQLYVSADRARTEEYVARLRGASVGALFVTVDAPQLGRREKDMRNKFESAQPSAQDANTVRRDQGVGRAISAFIDPSLCWDDVPWLRRISTGMRLLLKGVQCAEDALLALHAGVDGVVLSNHGGRQCDACRSAVEVLAEVMPALRADPRYSRERFAVFVDGGVRRGSDVFKAVALGATAVGVGRPVLYALAGYGQPGIERLFDVLSDELEMCMRLMGVPTLAHASEAHVSTRDLARHPTPSPRDHLSESTYEPLRTQAEIAARL